MKMKGISLNVNVFYIKLLRKRFKSKREKKMVFLVLKEYNILLGNIMKETKEKTKHCPYYLTLPFKNDFVKNYFTFTLHSSFSENIFSLFFSSAMLALWTFNEDKMYGDEIYPTTIKLSGTKHDRLVKIIHLYLSKVCASYNVIENSLHKTAFGNYFIVYFK